MTFKATRREMGKLKKEEVNYRPAKKERRCGNCTAFWPENSSCERVEGVIEPFMVCDKWTPLKGAFGRKKAGGKEEERWTP